MRGARLSVSVLLLFGHVAEARVGGGHHYSSPSRSSPTHAPSWSSNGSSPRPSGVSLTYGRSGFSPVYFAMDPASILLLILLAIVVVVLVRRIFGAAAVTQRALAEQDAIARLQIAPSERQAWVVALRRRDPRFAEGQFLDRVRSLFLSTQEAWSKGDLAPVRRFLSDATWLRFRVQLGLLRAQGVRNFTSDVQVAALELVGFEQNAWFDTLHVAVHAKARDVDVPAGWPDAQVNAAAAQAPSQPFIEVWSFVRKPGVQSLEESALASRKCPSCGAPFEGGATSSCSYCKAVVNSGAYDWVLAEITQAVEVRRTDDELPGLEAVREHDAALSLEVLEDRVSLIFWRWVEAQSTGRPERLARLAEANAVDRLRADVDRLRKEQSRRVFLECAVGEVRVRAFEKASDGRTLAHVEIRWSARTGVGPAEEAPPRLPVLPQRWVFTVARAGSATTRAEYGMSTDRCPQCGGPLGDELDPNCQWCETVLVGDLRDWTLADACPVEAWEGRPGPVSNLGSSTLPGFPDIEERERLLYVMAAMAMADGVVDQRERRLLVQCAERWGLPVGHVDVALAAGVASLDTLLPGAHAGEPFLRALAQLARVDGKVDAAERRLLETVASRLGLAQRLPALLASVGV